ncbi:MAG: hypothetical protein GXO56_03160 [Chloroflexi bacterium]|nr:hypothetical protein [Chloroflexota bacterium]
MREYHIQSVRPPRADEDALAGWFEAQRLKSPDTLEAAARQIVSLVTTLLGLLWAVLALGNDQTPAYVGQPLVGWLGVGVVVLLLAALACALAVLYPRRFEVPLHNVAAQRAAFEALMRHKATWLARAWWCFYCGVALLGVIVILALLAAA